jgi:hypothetical protein
MNKITKKILDKVCLDDVMERLRTLSGSELNSFLLELFRHRTHDMEASEVLKRFRENRFVRPSNDDALSTRRTEFGFLTAAATYGFQPVNLSPLAPLGTCSVLGPVHQHNVVSAVRGTEAVSDATNVLALMIAERFHNDVDKNAIHKLATIHRHVRGQHFTNPNFSAHFTVMGLASGGFDKGSYIFELTHLEEHIRLITGLLAERFDPEDLSLRFYCKEHSSGLLERISESTGRVWDEMKTSFVEDTSHCYYQLMQFKVLLHKNDREIDVGDGGFVDWTQKLLSNKKQRLLISGIPVELLERI